MINLTAGQLQTWMIQFFWPFIRVSSCLMVAPVFGAVIVPARVRLVLGAAIALIVAPLVAIPSSIAPFSLQGLVVTAQQIIIGVAFGFCLQALFETVSLGGELLANSMGLSFAFNMDPARGTQAPVVGSLYNALIVLTFLALNGHLLLVETLAQGFKTLPIGVDGLGPDGLWTVVQWGAELFAGALTIALPGVTALLIVNIAFGVMSRAAPTLNLFAVGLPVSLVFGLTIVMVGLPAVQSSFLGLLDTAFALVRHLSGLGG